MDKWIRNGTATSDKGVGHTNVPQFLAGGDGLS